MTDNGCKYISNATPIKPAIEVAQTPQPTTVTTTTTPALLRCAYTGNQLQIATGVLSNSTGLQIVEKPIHLQSTGFTQTTPNGVPSHGGLTVISDGIQASSCRCLQFISCNLILFLSLFFFLVHCDQSIFAQRSTATATPYLQLDHSTSTGNRTATFLHNRQLCAVIGVAQKTVTQYESAISTPTGGTTNVSTSSTTPTNNFLAPTTQAATIIVGHPEGTPGAVQYANDKVDSINLLSPNSGPGCISLPPRSARVFQLILPQSATALSLRPHPGSIGSASVIQLTTTGSTNLGATTIPLKQTPVVLETGLEASTIKEASIQDTTSVDMQASSELVDRHKTVQANSSSSVLTLAEWEQVIHSIFHFNKKK